MKIAIVANTIFPHNQPRAFRATELAKEFSSVGCEVQLFGVLGKYDYKTFEQQYGIKVHNIGPMKYYPTTSDGDSNPPQYHNLLSRLGGRTLAYPEIEFVTKTIKIIKHLTNVDLLITLAPSHAIHWGAAISKKITSSFPKVWIADCGDPFVGRENSKHLFYFKYIENFTFHQTDFITIPIENARKAYSSLFHHKIKVIPQGFNFNSVQTNYNQPKNEIPTFIYAGVFYKKIRDPSKFLSYLALLKRPFKFKLFIKDHSLVAPFKGALGDRLEINSFIPRDDLLIEMSKADFLVNFNNTNTVQSPSKLIDYAIVNRPILNIEQNTLPKKQIDEFLTGNYTNRFIVKDIDQYRIENVVSKFIDLYNRATSNSCEYQ